MTKLHKTVSFLVFVVCILIALQIHHSPSIPSHHSSFVVNDSESPSPDQQQRVESLRLEYYNETCPNAELIIRSTIHELYQKRPDIAPAMLRLVFHDCYPQGCDASVLLDNADGIVSEKEAGANRSLRNLDVIDIIKSKLEGECPGIVSCADIIALAARDSVFQAGGPFYPLETGRRDSTNSSLDKANELPIPSNDISAAVEAFASRGFDERETVALLGAHSVGKVHCRFFRNRLHKFLETDKPDPTLDTEFLKTLISTCDSSHLSSHAPSHSPSVSHPPSSSAAFRSLSESSDDDPAMKMDYEGPRTGFGTLYYKSLLQRRGILFVDQQLMASEETKSWVQAYASNVSLFSEDFGNVMIKLSNLQVLTAPMGQVRSICHKVN